ncbi:MAG: CBS domain-containing protein [Rhodospirillales bacterium]|nr:MAG: CBS domain-containing protein [Rhodospirillales bacterium]
MQVKDVMTRGVDLADPNMKTRDAAIKMRDDNVGALPVGEAGKLIGMVTDRDIVVRAVAGDGPAENMAVRQAMSEGIYYCFDDESLERAGELMAEHQVHRLPVLDHDKKLVGIVALADLAANGDEGLRAAAAALYGISQPTGAPRQ